MDWLGYRRNAVAFPTPCPTREIYYSHPNPNYRRSSPIVRERLTRQDRPWRKVDAISDFLDDTIAYSGDLGWTLDYATAWCYRHLLGSQPEVADAIDHVRKLGTVTPKTPYYIFEYLDKAIFGGKLQDMVYLRWKCQSSCSPGTTSAPNVDGIPRICVELNMTPFEDDGADIDDLLEALIHHMIHAYFLVCCGAQEKDDYQDGRLMDGLHFGVILLTIKDITKQCIDGVLSLVFHAFKRREYEGRSPLIPVNVLAAPLPTTNSRNTYISLDPRGSAVGPAAADGQTHCMHDNRKISWQQIKNWQVETYARAIDLHMDLKGLDIYDLDADGSLVQHSRLHVGPSATYVELLWDEKRIMVPRLKCLKFPSLERPIAKFGQFDLLVPDCTLDTFKCIYDFIQLETYRTSEYDLVRRGARVTKGPPVYVPAADTDPPSGDFPSIMANIKVFKAAEQMKFEELQLHALTKLWDAEMTGDNPIDAFRVLYNEDEPGAGPIHSELHRWARKFLVTKDGGVPTTVREQYPYRIAGVRLDPFYDQEPYTTLHHGPHGHGASNYEKMWIHHGRNFEELYRANRAFQDDVDIAKNELMIAGDPNQDAMRAWNSPLSLSSGPASLSNMTDIDPILPALRLSHRRSWSSYGDRVGTAWPSPYLQHTLDDLAIIPPNHARNLAIPRLQSQRLLGPGEKILRVPVHQWRRDHAGTLGDRRLW